MLVARARLGPAHVALTYLLVVLGASARGGRRLGLTIAVLAFAAFDVLFIPPYGALSVADPLDWLVLVAFLLTSAVAAQLLYRAQREARLAEARRGEVNALGARAEALREADRMKNVMLAAVSHDLRTPLTTIKAMAELLRADAAPDDERAAVIEGEADRLERMVSDLLDLSRLRGGALHIEAELVAADELLESVARAITGVPGAERVRMTIDPAEPLLVGRFDLVQSARALSDLVVNALKYGGDGPVEVTAARDEEWLAIRVADRGAGVPAAERERVFEPFYRGEAVAPGNAHDRATVRDGTGLGLSIARSLAQAQGGSLRLTDRDGGGSVFTLRLPAADVDTIPEPPAASL